VSLLFFAVLASVTSNVPVAPAGIETPFEPLTACVSCAVNLSPTLLLLLHTFVELVKDSAVPASIDPVVSPAGFGAAAGALGVDVAAGEGFGVGDGVLGLAAGVLVGEGVGATSTGVGGGVTGTSSNFGWALVSDAAMARSRPSALSRFSALSLAGLSPHATSVSDASAASSTTPPRTKNVQVGRGIRLYSAGTATDNAAAALQACTVRRCE